MNYWSLLLEIFPGHYRVIKSRRFFLHFEHKNTCIMLAYLKTNFSGNIQCLLCNWMCQKFTPYRPESLVGALSLRLIAASPFRYHDKLHTTWSLFSFNFHRTFPFDFMELYIRFPFQSRLSLVAFEKSAQKNCFLFGFSLPRAKPSLRGFFRALPLILSW